MTEYEKKLLETDTNVLTEEEIIQKNKIMIENNIKINSVDRNIFKNILKNKLNLKHDVVAKSKKNSTNLPIGDLIDLKQKKQHLIELIAKSTGIELELIKTTLDEVDIHLEDKLIIKAVFKLLSMRSISNSSNLNTCVNIHFKEEDQEILEEIEKERKKAYKLSILKEVSDIKDMSVYIIEAFISLNNIELDLNKDREIIVKNLINSLP